MQRLDLHVTSAVSEIMLFVLLSLRRIEMELNIYAYKCKRCGQLHYPYKTICKKCGDNDHNEFDIVALPKNGTLLTYTILYNPPSDFEVADRKSTRLNSSHLGIS